MTGDRESTPIIGARRVVDGRSEHEVTFRWWPTRPDPTVLLHLNGRTDTDRADIAPWLLRRTDDGAFEGRWWLPSDGTWTYRFVEADEIPTDIGSTRTGWLSIHKAGQLDPHNPRWIPHVHGNRSSVLEMPDCPVHNAWPPQPEARQHVVTTELDEPDGPRPVHLWRADEPADLLVVAFDGEWWREVGLADAIARAGIPVELLLIESVDLQRRAVDLPDPQRVESIVRRALDLRSAVGGRPVSAAEQVVVAGQSFGGLAAAGVVVHHPDLARSAIIQSGSFWYAPGVEPQYHKLEPGALLSDLDTGSPDLNGIRLHVQAGTDEGGMDGQALRFSDVAQRCGADVDTTIVTGGHDYAWWRHHLLFALEALTGHDAPQRGLS